jgi:uncharacterized membrane protein
LGQECHGHRSAAAQDGRQEAVAVVHAAGFRVAVAARAVEASLECRLGHRVPVGFRDLEEVAAAQAAGTGGRGVVRDWYAFTLSFKGVFLEGLEVAFIVVTFGNNQRNVPLAALGAAAAVLVVTGVGFAVRAPLAKVPENTMKFAVGTMLTSFGIFWSTEGSGAQWPGSDTALLAIVPAVALLALGCTALLRRTHTPAVPAVPAAESTTVEGTLR